MRRFYYIRPNLQHAFTLLYTFLTAAEILFFGVILYWVEKSSYQFPVDLRVYWKFSILFLAILVISAFNFWMGARLSHRIAGPLIQIQRALQQAITGNYRHRIHMRGTDYLHEIGDNLNFLLEKLEKEHNTEHSESHEKLQTDSKNRAN
ncbi:MAG: hypothetical protein P8184_02620 [Calditrichia bacterium]